MFPKRTALAAVAAALIFPAAAHASQPACVAAGTNAARHNLTRLPAAYRACRPAIAAKLTAAGIDPTTQNTRAAFATAVSHRYAPYGAAPVASFAKLRRQKFLACDKYTAFAYSIYTRIGGDGRDWRFVNWYFGVVGNHSQAFVGDLLVDATIGVVAQAPFRGVIRGVPYHHIANLNYAKNLAEPLKVGIEAIDRGQYRARDIRLVFTSYRAYFKDMQFSDMVTRHINHAYNTGRRAEFDAEVGPVLHAYIVSRRGGPQRILQARAALVAALNAF